MIGVCGRHPNSVLARALLNRVERPIKATAFRLSISGHTSATRLPTQAGYGPWELSSDRALVARRKIIQSGVADEQVREVHGFGDTVPMPGIAPTDEKNRRVSVLLRVGTGKHK